MNTQQDNILKQLDETYIKITLLESEIEHLEQHLIQLDLLPTTLANTANRKEIIKTLDEYKIDYILTSDLRTHLLNKLELLTLEGV